MSPSPADLRQRAQLERQYTSLTAQANKLSKQTFQLWDKIRIARTTGEDLLELETILLDTEEMCEKISRALLAINYELNNGEL